MKNREFGSDLYYTNRSSFRNVNPKSDFVDSLGDLYFSGRAALYAILSNGIDKFAWKKLFVPTYYCHEVYDFIFDLDIQIEFYDFNPISNNKLPKIDDKNDCVLLTVNYFGISQLELIQFKRIVTVEDLTLNLNGISKSKSDYCFGSLRKILPVPVGGFAKSNIKEIVLPKPKSSLVSEEVAIKKLCGMFLKKKYLDGEFNHKDIFRSILIEAETNFEDRQTNGEMPEFVKPFLNGLNFERIHSQKKKNVRLLKELIDVREKFKLITNPDDTEYACIMSFDTESTRNSMKEYLIRNNIYPIVLWPNQLNEVDKNVENTLLFVHVDYRYDSKDIKYIAEVINHY